MRLLKLQPDGGFGFTKDLADDIPPYAILSHTWGPDEDEVTYADITNGTGQDKAGFLKLELCAKQAASDGFHHIWVDTCFIDKSSSAELSTAINSMFRWYQKASKCYVYLSDVVKDSRERSDATFQPWEQALRKSRWFGRGWTLQELIAPSSVEFFSSEWHCLGDKKALQLELSEITGISREVLLERQLSDTSEVERMSWLANRQTKIPEDMAYCLLGIFGVHIPLIYGEGKHNAFFRLREEIQKHSASRRELPHLPKGFTRETNIRSESKDPASPSAVIPFSRDADFIERGVILAQIYQKCTTPGSRTALVGLGGVGKSQLAIEYAYRTRDRSPKTWVFWVHASNAARFEQSYWEIANCVKLSGRQEKEANIFQLVHDWLRDERREWLLILDNVDDARFLFDLHTASHTRQSDSSSSGDSRPLVSYLPRCQNGSVLITSRSTSAAKTLVDDCDLVAIDPMDEADAVALIRRKLLVLQEELTGAPNLASELAIALECMPLAIVQAVSYISQRAPRCSLRQYLETFRKSDRKKESLLNREGGQLRRDREAKNSILITWQISFDYIRQTRPSAADLLSLMSLFDRQGIPDVLLQNRRYTQPQQESKGKWNRNENFGETDSDSDNEDGSSKSSIDDAFEDDITALRDYSFISVSEIGTSFEMHRLVQLATRKWLKEHGQLEKWRQQFINNLDAEVPDGEYENWPKCQLFFPHVKVAAEQKPTEETCLKSWASVLYKAAWYAGKVGNWDESEKMLIQSIDARKEILGVEHEDTMSSMLMLATLLDLKGHWEAAEKLNVQVMDISKQKFGPDHPNTLKSMANLASTYRHTGRWDAAEKLETQVMEIRKLELGVDHPDTLTAMANVASTYSRQGRWALAEELLVRVIETRKQKLGASHPDTLFCMVDLASTYYRQGRWELAETLNSQVMEIRKERLGVNHPDTLISMGNLALTYSQLGRWKAAERLNSQVMEIRKERLGVNHPDTLTSMGNLALIYSQLGRWKAAEKLNSQVIEIRKERLEVNHPDTLINMSNLAMAYFQQGRWKEAEKLNMQVIEIRKENFGAEHPDTLNSIGNLAILYHKQGRLDAAEKLQTQVLEIYKNKFGADHPSTLLNRSNLASLYHQQGRLDAAEQLDVEVLEIRKNKLGADHPDTLLSMGNIAYIWKGQGRDDEAMDLMAEVVQLWQRIVGVNHPSYIESTKTLAQWKGERVAGSSASV